MVSDETPAARIMIATPSHRGTVEVECARSILQASVFCLHHQVVLEWVYVVGFSLLQGARNWLAALFLTHPQFTHLLWLDDDIGFEPDAVMKLLECNVDAVGGRCPMKLQSQPQQLIGHPSGPAVGYLQPMSAVGTGFLLVKRQVIETLAARCPSYRVPQIAEHISVPYLFDVALVDDPSTGERLLQPEDYLFCQRLLGAGFNLCARTDLAFAHVGRRVWVVPAGI
jgi:hypothetical protein